MNHSGSPLFVSFTTSDVLALVLAFLGFVGTTGMLIMNLKVTSAVQEQRAAFEKEFAATTAASAASFGKLELQLERTRLEMTRDHNQVKLDIAELRAKIAEDYSAQMQKVMADVQRTFMNRRVSEEMHASNSRRLDEMNERLQRIEEKINV